MTNNVTIYQIKNVRDTDYAFRGWEGAEKYLSTKPLTRDYDAVVNTHYNVSEYDCVSDFLEALYATYNSPFTQRPANMRSLSVSDIIKIDNAYYYCDNFGWVEITDKIKI